MRAEHVLRICLASMLLAGSAHAQTPACDRLKGELSGRITPGARGFTLDAVPAGDPVPPGSKVIGTCEAGAWKILLRRGGSVQLPSGGASAVVPASAPRVVAAQAAPMPASAPAPAAEKSPDASASAVEVMPVVDPAPATRVPFGQRASEFLARYWPWVLAPVLLVLAGLLWAWIAHHRAYDEAGLPRGPKLN